MSTLLSDPVVRQIKVLARMNNAVQPNTNSSNDKKRVVSEKYRNVLLPDEWLELSPAYLSIPPILDTPQISDVLNVKLNILLFLDVFHIHPRI